MFRMFISISFMALAVSCQDSSKSSNDPKVEGLDTGPYAEFVVPEGYSSWEEIESLPLDQLDGPVFEGIDPNASLFTVEPVPCALHFVGVTARDGEDYWILRVEVDEDDGSLPPLALVNLAEYDGESIEVRTRPIEFALFMDDLEFDQITQYNVRWLHDDHYHFVKCTAQ